MTGRATAGEFLHAAAAHLGPGWHAAAPRASRAEADAITAGLARLMRVLARYLDDSSPLGTLKSPLAVGHDDWSAAASRTHHSLTEAARLLAFADPAQAQASGTAGDGLAGRITSATTSLELARDLLHTHFTADGQPASEWARIVSSRPVGRAAVAEVSWWAKQMAPVLAGLEQHYAPGRHRVRWIRDSLRSAGVGLWEADAAIQLAHRNEPVRAADVELLRGIPVNSPLPRLLPEGAEPVAALCQGTLTAAERLRRIIWDPAPATAPDICDTSMRHTAAAAVVISHNCAEILEVLAARAADADIRGISPGAAAEAAAAAHGMRSRWLAAARAWGEGIATDTTGRTSPVCGPADDLAVWTGRLVYQDPQWTPARGRRGGMKAASEVLPHQGELGNVIAAAHSTTETLTQLAAAEHTLARGLASAGRLHSPTRTLREFHDIPRLYGPGRPSTVSALMDTYQALEEPGPALPGLLAEMAVTVQAPSRFLAAARGPGQPVQVAGWHGNPGPGREQDGRRQNREIAAVPGAAS
jgi:hypothetical protein